MREKFETLIKQLNSAKIIQKWGGWKENIPREILDEHFVNTPIVLLVGLNPVKHRWYEESMVVIQIYDHFLGINLVSNIFSESMDYEDCYHTIEFFEMEEIQTTTYKILSEDD